MQPLSLFLAGFSGFLGILIGCFVSGAAIEELQEYKQVYRMIRDYLFLFSAGIVLFQAGIIVLIIGLFLLTTVLKEFSKDDVSKAIILLMVILLIITSNSILHPFIAGLLLIIGVAEAGFWSSNNKKIIKKGFLKKEFLQALLQSHKLYLLLPLANLVFLL